MKIETGWNYYVQSKNEGFVTLLSLFELNIRMILA